MDVIKIPFLQKEKKFSYKKEGISILGSVLVGAAFAAAWTPCASPILGSILVYASGTASAKAGVMLLVAFSLGLGIPFFLSALVISSFLTFIKKIEKYIRVARILFGIALIIFGVTLLIGG
jgi:cytochrome c-type biogenesis protein